MPRSVDAAQRALFILDNFTHWIDLSYQYEGMHVRDGGRTSSSSSQLFKEGYGLNLGYAVYNPHILKGSFSAGANLDQRESRSYSSNKVDLQYAVSGVILDRSDFPGSFYSSMETNYVQEPFLPSYNLTTNNKGFSISINNKFMPVYFAYSDSNSETSGLALERKQESDSFSLLVQNNFLEISQTSLSLSGIHGRNSDGDSPALNSSTTSMKITNNLSLSRSEYYRTLYSLLQIDKAKYTDDRTTLWWSEVLTWDLGKALRSQLDYQLIVRDSDLGREESRRVHGGLRHKLFDSLVTEINGQKSDISQTNGQEDSWSGSVNLTYQKALPEESSLRLTYQHQYDVVDRNQSRKTTSVVDEPHAVAFGVPIFLGKPDVVQESIVVRNANLSTRPTPYLLDIDYSVRPVGQLGEIVILPGSAIRTGDNLVLSYDYRVNPTIKFDTTVQGFGADLWLFNNRYRWFGKLDLYDQDLLSGKDDQIRLNNGYIIRAGVEANLFPIMIQANYDGYELDFDKHDSYVMRAQYTRNFPRSSYMANIFDSYTVTRPNSYTGTANSGDVSVNTAGMGSSYTRNLFSTAFMTLAANYFNTQGKDINRNELSCRLDFRWNYGKLQFSFFSQGNWRFESGRSSDDESVQLQLRRYF